MSVSPLLRRLTIVVAATQVLMLFALLATQNNEVVSLLASLSPWIAAHTTPLALISNAIVLYSVISVPVIAAVDPHAEVMTRRMRPIYVVWGVIFIACLSYLLLLVILGLQASVFAALSNHRFL